MATQDSLILMDRGELQTTPMDLLKIAMSKDVDVDKLTKLWELNVQYQAAMAKREYNAAMTAFKQNPPEIHKNKEVKFGNTQYSHATLDHVADVIGKALSAYGFSHKWEVSQADATITVKCTIRHKEGHEESISISAGADVSGSKNGIQAIGSTITYLERYTLLAATGLAASNDDDGNGSGGKLDDVAERIEYIANCRNEAELKKVYAEAYKAAAAVQDKSAMSRIMAAYKSRQKELSC